MSYNQQTSIDAGLHESVYAGEIKSVPHMEPVGIDLLARQLVDCTIYLEYGSGGSSVMASKTNVRRIYSVDSDKAFLNGVSEKIASVGALAGVYVPIYVDIGRTGDWGVPQEPNAAERWPNYVNEPWSVMKVHDESPDLILIDGRFRVASFLISALLAKPGCVVLFDDYFDRPHYHVVEKYIKPLDQAGRMAKFIVPEHRSDGLVQELLRYCTKFF